MQFEQEVVRDDDRDVRPLVHGVQQPRHARMGEGRVADHGDRGVLSRVGGAFGHGDRGPHVHAGVDGVERSQPPQRVAADIAENLAGGIFLADHLGQCGVHVAVSASLTQCGRAGHDDLAGGVCPVRGHPEGRAHAVGRELPGAGQFARQASPDRQGTGQYAPHGLLHDGLPLLDDEQRLAFRGYAPHQVAGQRVLRQLQHRMRTAVRVVLHHVIMGDAAGDDAQPFVRTLRIGVERACGSLRLQSGVVVQQDLVPHARIARHEYPLAGFGGRVQCVFGARFRHIDHRPRVGHAGRQAHQHRNPEPFRKFERGFHHIVSLLLGGGFESRHEGEFSVEARILLVLRGVHRRVVGHDHHQSAVGPGHRRVDEGVGSHVQSHVFHADQRAFAGERHAERLLHGRLFVRRPRAVDAARDGEGMILDIFGDFGRGCTRISIDARQSRMERPQREGFVSE